MRLKCEYCEHYLADTDERCPNCGAPNPNLKRNAVKIPQTIEELKAFCAQHNLPLEKMHFHIGEDYKEPKAFGIYKDEKTENFVVYKNKSDGTRAVRYEGKDEAYAVNEIYQKMKAEITEERAYSVEHGATMPNKNSSSSTKNSNKRIGKIIGIVIACYMGVILLCAIIGGIFGFLGNTAGTGYYKYNGDLYYQRNGSWYIYDNDYNDWYSTTVDDDLQDNYEDYFESYSYDSSYGGSNYTDSDSYYSNYYDTDNNWDDDWDDDDWDYDSGSSWDSGWDSGYDSDWDSDW